MYLKINEQDTDDSDSEFGNKSIDDIEQRNRKKKEKIEHQKRKY